MINLFYFLLFLVLITQKRAQIIIDHSLYDQEKYIQAFFHNVTGQFFADIGAYDPSVYSNTANLYSQGWNGVNVEASSLRAPRFWYLRPEMTTVNAAIGKQDSMITLKQMSDDSSSTVSQNYEQYLYKSRPSLKVNNTQKSVSVSLKQLCERYFYRRPLLINLDIQGNQALGLKGNDWKNSKCRPDIWIVQVYDKSLIKDGLRYGLQLPQKILQQNGYKRFDKNFSHEQVYIEQKLFEMYSKKYENFNKSQYIFLQQKTIVNIIYEKLKVNHNQEIHYQPLYNPLYKHHSVAGSPLIPAQLNRLSNVINRNQTEDRPVLVLNYNPLQSQIIIRKGQKYSIFDYQEKNYHFWHLQITKQNNKTFSVYIYDHKNDPKLIQLPIVLSSEIQQLTNQNIYQRQKKFIEYFQSRKQLYKNTYINKSIVSNNTQKNTNNNSTESITLNKTENSISNKQNNNQLAKKQVTEAPKKIESSQKNKSNGTQNNEEQLQKLKLLNSIIKIVLAIASTALIFSLLTNIVLCSKTKKAKKRLHLKKVEIASENIQSSHGIQNS